MADEIVVVLMLASSYGFVISHMKKLSQNKEYHYEERIDDKMQDPIVSRGTGTISIDVHSSATTEDMKSTQKGQQSLSLEEVLEKKRKEQELVKEQEEEQKQKELQKQKEELRRLVTESVQAFENEKATGKGKVRYERILEYWPVYRDLIIEREGRTNEEVCELVIIDYLLSKNASIKKQSNIEKLEEIQIVGKVMFLQAMDQLLIKRIMVIAVEGSLEYYRINLDWSIETAIRQLAKEKKN